VKDINAFYALQLAAMPREIAMKRGLPIPFSPTFSKDYLDQLACDLIVSPDGMIEPFSLLCLLAIIVSQIYLEYSLTLTLHELDWLT